MPNSVWTCETIPCGPDPLSGAVVTQLTSEPVTSHNIYCEQRYTSADGARIAIARKPFGKSQEVWVCDLEDRPQLTLGAVGIPLGANADRNAIYYHDRVEGAERLMRLDLKTLGTSLLHVFDGEVQTGGYVSPDAPKGALSPDERWYVGGPFPVRDNIYALRRVDLADGTERTLCEVADMFNPHMQFDPSGSGRVLVQVNRGGSPRWKRDGRGLMGPLGSTLILVDARSGDVTPLPVGLPDTGRLSGHLCWIGQSGRILFTGAPGVTGPLATGRGVYVLTPGDAKARQIVADEPFNHIAASEDGRFFVVDNWKTQRVCIGSIATGRFHEFCDSHTRQGNPQHTHAHPYLTPEQKYVIFNSCATGIAQVYAARVPDGFLEDVARKA